MIQKVKDLKKNYLSTSWPTMSINYIKEDIEIVKILYWLRKEYCPYCGKYGKGSCCEE